MCLEGLRATLGFFFLAFWSTGSTVVRQEVEKAQARYFPDMEQCIFWHFADLNFKYFCVLHFALIFSHVAAPSVDDILSTRTLQRLG